MLSRILRSASLLQYPYVGSVDRFGPDSLYVGECDLSIQLPRYVPFASIGTCELARLELICIVMSTE